ncbi:TIGR03571 family LLM class oxidoreductase [Priestia flexa]|uniref:TIGR03571 family LLM class oxidoreductase n=1 Tax=Priestia flexa TaxID=86664 RepID=UPI000956D26D|nr:TIGR03571 family LLM class oxidoreductase [Priestia flexa]MBY6087791.1 TIGR03571 family LLM class oxidoreductase [Priestia flexa]MCA1202857.1 TIGR03571 family LLM class oxidoreductase [Priestia flexa]MCG7314299.1 TIGR03571 family LLM class oxidoreductase [Priestia flexa]MCP1187953.1 TIGR03571 family LLM class oxidoreductase [Priestia flexa]QCS54456.1 TIGR03571 family LLM class oxidoreductase [Priestia flexa]
MSLLQHRAYNRLYQKDKMTLGFAIPTARMSKYPIMENQLSLARKIEDHGFAALWLRDVTIQNLNIDDNGQMYDVWIYLTYLAAHTKDIALGTASVVLPLRHPVRVAKEASSIDRLFPERLIMGVASGDRDKDFTALGISKLESGELFKKNYAFLERLLKEDRPTINSDLGVIDGTDMRMIPKPFSSIPTMVTGFSNQSIEWIAQNGDGWIHYPRIIPQQAQLINEYRELSEIYAPGVFKPFTQTLFIDLSENPDASPVPIPLGFHVGRKQLLEILYQFQSIGVNHLAFVLYFSKRPPEEVIQELGEFVRPYFPTHEIPV